MGHIFVKGHTKVLNRLSLCKFFTKKQQVELWKSFCLLLYKINLVFSKFIDQQLSKHQLQNLHS